MGTNVLWNNHFPEGGLVSRTSTPESVRHNRKRKTPHLQQQSCLGPSLSLT